MKKGMDEPARVESHGATDDGTQILLNVRLASGELVPLRFDAAELDAAIALLIDAGARAEQLRMAAAGHKGMPVIPLVATKIRAVTGQGVAALQFHVRQLLSPIEVQIPLAEAEALARDLLRRCGEEKARHRPN